MRNGNEKRQREKKMRKGMRRRNENRKWERI